MGRWLASRWTKEGAIELARSTEHNNPAANPWKDSTSFEVLEIQFDADHVEKQKQQGWD